MTKLDDSDERPLTLWEAIHAPLPASLLRRRRFARGTEVCRLRVLMVHGDPSIRAMVQCTARGAMVVGMGDVERAIELLHLHRFDAVVTDSLELLAHADVFHGHVHRVLFRGSGGRDVAPFASEGIIEHMLDQHNPWALLSLLSGLAPRAAR